LDFVGLVRDVLAESVVLLPCKILKQYANDIVFSRPAIQEEYDIRKLRCYPAVWSGIDNPPLYRSDVTPAVADYHVQTVRPSPYPVVFLRKRRKSEMEIPQAT